VNIFSRKYRLHLSEDEKKKLKKERLLLILGGILLGISFPPLPLPQPLFIGLIPYLFVIENREGLGSINRATYLMAFVFGLLTLYWVGSWQSTADPFLMISGALLVFVNPVFFLIPSTIYFYCRKIFNKTAALFLLPFFWITYEYAYMLTDASFPWLSLGNGLTKFLSFIQIADVVGTLGLSLIIFYINIFLYKSFLFIKENKKRFALNFSAALILFLIPIIYGLNRLSTFHLSENKIKVGLIQPNLDPWDKWSGGGLDEIAQLHLDLSEQAVKKGAEIIFWPETAFPVYLLGGTYPQRVKKVFDFVEQNNVYLLTGMPDVRYYYDDSNKPEDAKYNEAGDYYYATYNAILLFSPDNVEVQKYGKSKLVPFGERVPFVDALPFLGNLIKWGVGLSGWNVGRDTSNFSVPASHFSNLQKNDSLHINGLVCYESIYPYYVSEFVDRGAELIAVVTNDSWYGKLSGPFQHKEFAVLRAVENRRSVIRAANGGISCIINPLGITEVESEMFEKTFIAGDVIIQNGETFFTKYPLVIPVISSVISLMMILIFILSKLKLIFRKKLN